MDSEGPNSERDSLETVVVALVEEEEEEGQGVEEHREPGASLAEERDVSLQSNNRSNNRRSQFRPRPGGKAGATSYQLRQYAEATLGGGSLRKIVKLPEGEDENEWFAVNSMPWIPPKRECTQRLTWNITVVDFYNQINLLYGAITEFCSPQSCPEMKATDEYVEDPQTSPFLPYFDSTRCADKLNQVRVPLARQREL